MAEKLKLLFTDATPGRLHYIFGANCYQHAIGFKHPIFCSDRVGSDILAAYYINLQPGTGFYGTAKSLEEFGAKVLDGCHEDGITEIGKTFNQCAGHRSIAIFTGTILERSDYHFAFLNDDNKWEAKTPFGEVETFESIKEIEEKTPYKLLAYGLAPDGMRPSILDKLSLKLVTYGNKENDPDSYGEILIVEGDSHALDRIPFSTHMMYTDYETTLSSRRNAAPLPPLNNDMIGTVRQR